jgi:pimeloyl-ACP methyl ester carboxylesterase
MIDAPHRTTVLADGRTLTWREYGAPDGEPALYFHGGGSTSLEGGIFHREAADRGVRLIATDRPGAGGSTLRPGRPVAAYSDDLVELLATLDVGEFACFGESNGGLVTMAVAATLPDRVRGGVPINPTVPWHDPVARRVTSRAAAVAYRLMRHAPWLLTALDRRTTARPETLTAHIPVDIEPDVGAFHARVMLERAPSTGLRAELDWANGDWGFDPHRIPVPLDFFCGVEDAQAPFALVLAQDNPDARFHHFAGGHHGYSHPDARHRILDTVCGFPAVARRTTPEGTA